ncbi:MAG TPA: sigma-70 family RNA polymerase sigma factor [Woeseiaceae bacterium]|nr:sigma-70 family RNA polymerase sigma factor [Woeseiaceae bacterium]
MAATKPTDTTRPADEARGDSETGTLGDLLYADTSKSRVSEQDWVALVQAVASRDQRALQALYERTHRLVFTLILRITGNRETAEEVTLDVYHDVWRRAPDYDVSNGSVLGWIMNQARSRSIDRLRSQQRKKRVDPHRGDPVPPAAEREPQEVFDLAEQGRLLRKALGVLTPDERQAIEIAYFSEFTHKQVAAQLNEPLGTVKTRIRSGLSKLRQALAGT